MLPNFCPWQNFSPDDLYFCETQVCSWIRQPANTWSSLIIVVVGLLIIYLTLIKKQHYLTLFGILLTFLGLGTFFYHMTAALWAGVFDLAGMFFLIFYLLVTILWEAFHINKKLALTIFVVGSGLLTSLHALKPNLGTPFFAVIALVSFILELRLAKTEPLSSRKYLRYFIVFAVLALVAWSLDTTKLVCDPNNHLFQGHAAWHGLSAGAFLFLYFHLSKVKLPRWKFL